MKTRIYQPTRRACAESVHTKTRRKAFLNAPRLRCVILMLLCLMTLSGSFTFAQGVLPSGHSEIRVPSSPWIPDRINNFDYSVPDRYDDSWEAWDPVSRQYAESFVNPSSWSVALDLCSFSNSRNPKYYYIHIERLSSNSDWSRTRNAKECTVEFSSLPSTGTYQVTFAARTEIGWTEPETKTITLKDYLIVSLGDSFASGEGSPDVWPDGWQDDVCHRSARSGQALFAEELEASDDRTSVTFLSFACSGAKISTGLLFPQSKSDVIVDPQIEAFAQQIYGRSYVDALLVSAGGNDAGFSSVVKVCADWRGLGDFLSELILEDPLHFLTPQGLAEKVDAFFKSLASVLVGEEPSDCHRAVVSAFASIDLADRYQRVQNEIVGKVSASIKETYLVGYPIDLFEYRLYNTITTTGSISGSEGCGALWGITEDDADLLRSGAGELRRSGTEAAAEHGWNFVPVDFGGHGYCSDDTWLREYSDPDDFVLHPNHAGYKEYSDQLGKIVYVGTVPLPFKKVSFSIDSVLVEKLDQIEPETDLTVSSGEILTSETRVNPLPGIPVRVKDAAGNVAVVIAPQDQWLKTNTEIVAKVYDDVELSRLLTDYSLKATVKLPLRWANLPCLDSSPTPRPYPDLDPDPVHIPHDCRERAKLVDLRDGWYPEFEGLHEGTTTGTFTDESTLGRFTVRWTIEIEDHDLTTRNRPRRVRTINR